eukprot:m.212086 g.212086  ORF g.212086 m.212086 type:complete len:489 (-) comp18583_c0_seq6:35-1501(-)
MAPRKKAAMNQGPVATKAVVGASLVMPGKRTIKVGSMIGQGGFGAIHLAKETKAAGSSSVTAASADLVVKIEAVDSGGLFSEMKVLANLNLATWQSQDCSAWKRQHKYKHLGLPRMLGCITTSVGRQQYRVMALDRLGDSIHAAVKPHGPNAKLSPGAAFRIALDVVNALEYVHDHGYVHADIKGANLCRGRHAADKERVYLIDFGIACSYHQPSGDHIAYDEDPRRRHDGTLEFTSVDAHRGVKPSRRADFQILGYVMLQWLGGDLPWGGLCEGLDKKAVKARLAVAEKVYAAKLKFHPGKGDKGVAAAAATKAATALVKACIPDAPKPIQSAMISYFKMALGLGYQDVPSYAAIRKLFSSGASSSLGALVTSAAGSSAAADNESAELDESESDDNESDESDESESDDDEEEMVSDEKVVVSQRHFRAQSRGTKRPSPQPEDPKKPKRGRALGDATNSRSSSRAQTAVCDVDEETLYRRHRHLVARR